MRANHSLLNTTLRIVGIVVAWICIGACCMVAHAQSTKVITTVEPTSIRIGEHSKLIIKVVHNPNDSTRLLLPEKELVPGVEILGIQEKGSNALNTQLQEKIYEVTITSFDSAMYTISGVKALVGGQEVTSEDSPKLIVNTVEVDASAPDKFYDIKEQLESPFVWYDYIVYLFILIGVGLLILNSYILYHFFKRRNKKSTKTKVIQEEIRDPYQDAVNAIMNLKAEEGWKSPNVKWYYTQITDILRDYIQHIWNIPTHDKTSGEILEHLREMAQTDTSSYANLRRIFETADLAKFAKYKPTPEEGAQLLNATEKFIQDYHTYPSPAKGEEPDPATP